MENLKDNKYTTFVPASEESSAPVYLGDKRVNFLAKKQDKIYTKDDKTDEEKREIFELPQLDVNNSGHRELQTLRPRYYSQNVVLDLTTTYQTLSYFLCASFQKDGKTTPLAILERYDHVSYGQSRVVSFDFSQAKVFKSYKTGVKVTPKTIITLVGYLTVQISDSNFSILKVDQFQPFHFASDSTHKKNGNSKGKFKKSNATSRPVKIILPKDGSVQSPPSTSPTMLGQKRARQDIDDDDDPSAKHVAFSPTLDIQDTPQDTPLDPDNVWSSNDDIDNGVLFMISSSQPMDFEFH